MQTRAAHAGARKHTHLLLLLWRIASSGSLVLVPGVITPPALSRCTVVKWLRMEKCCFMSVASTSSMTTWRRARVERGRAHAPRRHHGDGRRARMLRLPQTPPRPRRRQPALFGSRHSPRRRRAARTFLKRSNSALGKPARKWKSGCCMSVNAAARWWFSSGLRSL
jgi:hypothetical protein